MAARKVIELIIMAIASIMVTQGIMGRMVVGLAEVERTRVTNGVVVAIVEVEATQASTSLIAQEFPYLSSCSSKQTNQH